YCCSAAVCRCCSREKLSARSVSRVPAELHSTKAAHWPPLQKSYRPLTEEMNMNVLKLFFAGAVLSVLSSLASAAANPLSVHVLNLQDGLPSPDVNVTLEKKNGQGWEMLNTASTNEQGRIPAF